MSNSRYEYVKNFEQDPCLLAHCWVVARVDGRAFHRFATLHRFQRPNDDRALHLMNHCAAEVVRTFRDIVIAIGMSDEFRCQLPPHAQRAHTRRRMTDEFILSFVFKRDTALFSRRISKINSSVVSTFTAAYVMNWSGANATHMHTSTNMLTHTRINIHA
jgi:tRNA(His) guanylyltransferase